MLSKSTCKVLEVLSETTLLSQNSVPVHRFKLNELDDVQHVPQLLEISVVTVPQLFV